MRKGFINFVIPAVTALLALGAILAVQQERLARPLTPERRAIIEADRIRARLRERIAAEGLEKTYAAIERDPTADVAAKHGEAHIFGELAYEKEGIDAIRVCDAEMTFGCYHGLIVRALAREGLGALPKIDAACVEAHGKDDTGCRHGIGHGLAEYFSVRDLADALDRCSAIQPPGLLGCTQGVFMEYANVAADDPRIIDRSRPYEPCTSVAARYKASCYFEQPYLWHRLFGDDAAASAERCATLTGDERQACLLGLGRSIAEFSRYNGPASVSGCGALPPDERMPCLAGAHWLFVAVERPLPWPCESLQPPERAACVRLSEEISDVGQ
ncbi:MAG TPA: hypothetical protein VL426_07585 [Candidatus Binatia bacterium]|jgi:hypothetical protein|nr:hypothetical protein [Candidatus Binatia bacterium]